MPNIISNPCSELIEMDATDDDIMSDVCISMDTAELSNCKIVTHQNDAIVNISPNHDSLLFTKNHRLTEGHQNNANENMNRIKNPTESRPPLMEIDATDDCRSGICTPTDTIEFGEGREVTDQNDAIVNEIPAHNSLNTNYYANIQQFHENLTVRHQNEDDENIKVDSSQTQTYSTRCKTLKSLGTNSKKDSNNMITSMNTNSYIGPPSSRKNTRLLVAIERQDRNEVFRILADGANPNATCHVSPHISACHVGAYANAFALHLLLEHNVEKNRVDNFGRTPLHLAAWAGNNQTIAMLLNFPTSLKNKLSNITNEVEDEIKELRALVKPMIDVPCKLPLTFILPQSWEDTIEHKCGMYMRHLPTLFSGWTPLHVASFAGNHNSTRLLLAAGADPNSMDAIGRTPLDIVGAACCLDSYQVDENNYLETIKTLIRFGGQLNMEKTTPSNSDSALHIAVELCNVKAIKVLLAVGAPITQHNARGNTPLHECVSKKHTEALQVFLNHRWSGQTKLSADVTDSSGNTVLHKAILTSWVSGVCLTLNAAADVGLKNNNGFTAVHLAARNGNLNILNEVLKLPQSKKVIAQNTEEVESILFCAIRSGNLDCVQRIVETGASTRLTTYIEPPSTLIAEPHKHTLSEEEYIGSVIRLNMIVHATAEVGCVDILEFLFKRFNFLESLLEYKCPYLRNMIPVEFSAFHNRFDSFKFLLQITVQRMQATFDPSVLLDIVAISNQESMLSEIVKLIPDAVYIARRNGNCPLHSAIKFGRRNIIEQFIKNGGDLSQCDQMGNSSIDLLMEYRSKPSEFISSIFDCYIKSNDFPLHNQNCRITVDYSVLIPTKLNNEAQMSVLKALLNTGNNEDQRKLLAHPLVESFLYLKWKTLSTFIFVMIFLYSIFVTSISVYIVSVYYYKDKNRPVPNIWDPNLWQYVIYYQLCVIVIQELSCVNLDTKTWISSIVKFEFWVKIGTFVLAIVMPQFVIIESPDTESRRHLATLTLVLSWLNIMLLLSKTPISGYYMQMFWKVSIKIVKILTTFLFLILMFAFSFMVQFHTKEPFEGPWEAFVKTLVMMTSEFDYSDTFTEEHIDYKSSSIQFLRFIFVVFVILAAIVLMNLMIGVAVNDVQNLVQYGNLRRLEKEVEFLTNLEASTGKKSIFNILGLYRLSLSKKVPQKVKIKLVREKNCRYPQNIKEALMNKAQEQLDKLNKQAESMKNEMKLDEILKALALKEQKIMTRMNELINIVREIQQTQYSQNENSNFQ